MKHIPTILKLSAVVYRNAISIFIWDFAVIEKRLTLYMKFFNYEDVIIVISIIVVARMKGDLVFIILGRRGRAFKSQAGSLQNISS